MQPNLDKGKTEVLLSLRGKGADQWRKHLFNRGGKQSLDIVTEEGMVAVHVAAAYKHLGGVVHHSGECGQELRQRFAQAQQAFTEHRKLLFHNHHFTLSQRTKLLDTLVLSKLLYGTESMVMVKQQDIDYAESALFRLYKRLLGTRHDKHLEREQLLASLELPDFALLQRRARLRYLATALRCATGRTWGVLSMDVLWRRLLQEDLDWMWKHLVMLDPLPDPGTDLSAWQRLITSRPGYWKKLVNRATRCAVLQRKHAHLVRAFHSRFCTRLRELGVLDFDDMEQQHTAYGCMQCRVGAKSKGGEGAHMFRIHGRRAPERFLFDSTCCPSCLKEFHTVTKIQRHLHHSRKCRESLRRLPGHEPLPEHDELLPSLQTAGPRAQEMAPVQWANWSFIEDVLMVLHPDGNEDIRSDLEKTIASHPIAWSDCKASFEIVRSELQAQDQGSNHVMIAECLQLLEELSQPGAWPFLVNGRSVPLRASQRPLEDWDHILEHNIREQTSPWSGPSRPFSKHRVILHLFSGRRRFGDMQWFMERIPEQPGTTLHIISLDLIFHEKWGDLSREETQRWWIDALRRRWVVAMLAGPPCSTWSQARGRHVEGRRTAPRVIRTADQPWGIDTVAVREAQQLIEGSTLLLFCVEAALELWHAHGACMIEHPATPDEVSKASIWRTKPLCLLRQLPGCALQTLNQGFYGAKSLKPTQVLTVNLSCFSEQFRQCRVTSTPPMRTSIGVSKTGEWHTTGLKEYPPCFNIGIARTFAQFLQALPYDESSPSEQFWQTVAPMRAGFSRSMGLDHQIRGDAN